jgi:hypothetical protein
VNLVAAGTPLVIAFGPTKIFNTFAYRPGGATLAICRSAEEADSARARMKRIERGSSGFIDVATLALVHALADDAAGLRRDHAAILARLAEAAADWRAHAAGTPLEQYFTDAYGGLFRIVVVEARRDRPPGRAAHSHRRCQHVDGGPRPDQHDGSAARRAPPRSSRRLRPKRAITTARSGSPSS